MSAHQKLTPEQALHAALLALGTARPGERMSHVSFWTFASHLDGIGDGAGWSVAFVRCLGLDKRAEVGPDEQPAWQRKVIEVWRREFYPDPKPTAAADLRQPEAT